MNQPCNLTCYTVASAVILISHHTVPVIGFERAQYSVVEGDTAPTEVCVTLMPLPTLDRTVTVSLITTDGTAQGKCLATLSGL